MYSMKAVSYTHLDVYKRQVKSPLWILQSPCCTFHTDVHTHLEVATSCTVKSPLRILQSRCALFYTVMYIHNWK